MDKETVLKSYSLLGINSQTGLYDYVISHDEATIDETVYNLNNSNESMEFMANFLNALGFEVKRLYLEKSDDENKRHWFLAFNNGFKWFYYEVNIENIIGQYTFSNYKNLITFALAKIIKDFENFSEINNNDMLILQKYNLKEIEPLKSLNLYENIVQSKNGSEILAWSNLNHQEDYNRIIKKAEKEEIKNRKGDTNFVFFAVGFVITLGVGVFLVWLLAMYFYGGF